jgi:uncharacterized protein
MQFNTAVISPRTEQWIEEWQAPMVKWVTEQMFTADSGHGIDHVRRVVENAVRIGDAEKANPDVFMPAAWLHDCVTVSKSSSQRAMASTLAAQSAERFLYGINYPSDLRAQIAHCIKAHSYSAAIKCETLEAKVVQDADRLEALGAVGLARCLMTGGVLRHKIYHPDSPFPFDRLPKENEYTVDHFFAKLVGLQHSMQTASGRSEARRRTEFLIIFLRQLAEEIGCSQGDLDKALATAGYFMNVRR